MQNPLTQKITELNSTTFSSFDSESPSEIIKNFTQASIKILEADFGFAWWHDEASGRFTLSYKCPDTPYDPNKPREKGGNFQALKSHVPVFVNDVKPENYEPGYDVSPFMGSYVIIPISFKNFVFGSLVICFKNQKNFSEDEKSLSLAIGNTAAQAIAINNLLKAEKNAGQHAKNQEARFRSLIENSYDAIALLDNDGKIKDISNSISKLTGFSPKSLLGQSIYSLVHSQDAERFKERLRETLTLPKKPQSIEFRYADSSGNIKWMEAVLMNMLENKIVEAVVINVRDVTERMNSQETIKQQALHDSLTGLPNREKFNVLFEQCANIADRQHTQMAIMFLDLDRFKNINDRLGHSAGDTLLKIFASRFTTALRSEDVIARFGGDEFLILINELTSPTQAAEVAEKILKSLSVPVKLDNHTIHPSTSIGIAMYPDDGRDKEILKKKADIALYEAKNKGRNRFSFYDSLNDDLVTWEKLTFENELYEAINSNQIKPFYQAVISLKNKTIESVEALARWDHPIKGLLLPSDFIPLAEETGLIKQIHQQILLKACSDFNDFKKYLDQGTRMAVNVSATRFSEPTFVKEISELLEESNINPSNLELEITETTAMRDVELTHNNLRSLKKLGIKVSIDDFGTGYSSLSYLKKFPVDNLKIDRSFIHSSIISEQDTAIVKTIIAMAKNLNMKVVAEGVETKQQFDLLLSLDCDFAQGFFINKPMPREKFIKFLDTYNRI